MKKKEFEFLKKNAKRREAKSSFIINIENCFDDFILHNKKSSLYEIVVNCFEVCNLDFNEYLEISKSEIKNIKNNYYEDCICPFETRNFKKELYNIKKYILKINDDYNKHIKQDFTKDISKILINIESILLGYGYNIFLFKLNKGLI